MSMSTSTAQPKKSIWPLIILLIVFIGPFAFAWYYYQTKDMRSFKQVNHGDLIQPAKDIATLTFTELETEKDISGADLKGHWWIWYVSPDRCLQECHDNLYNIKQLITALGKDSDRVHSLFLNLPDCQVQACEKFVLDHYPHLKILQLDSGVFNQFLAGTTDVTDRERIGEIYISDPSGFLMMRYSGEINHQYILKDLKRLLKVSKLSKAG